MANAWIDFAPLTQGMIAGDNVRLKEEQLAQQQMQWDIANRRAEEEHAFAMEQRKNKTLASGYNQYVNDVGAALTSTVNLIEQQLLTESDPQKRQELKTQQQKVLQSVANGGSNMLAGGYADRYGKNKQDVLAARDVMVANGLKPTDTALQQQLNYGLMQGLSAAQPTQTRTWVPGTQGETGTQQKSPTESLEYVQDKVNQKHQKDFAPPPTPTLTRSDVPLIDLASEYEQYPPMFPGAQAYRGLSDDPLQNVSIAAPAKVASGIPALIKQAVSKPVPKAVGKIDTGPYRPTDKYTPPNVAGREKGFVGGSNDDIAKQTAKLRQKPQAAKKPEEAKVGEEIELPTPTTKKGGIIGAAKKTAKTALVIGGGLTAISAVNNIQGNNQTKAAEGALSGGATPTKQNTFVVDDGGKIRNGAGVVVGKNNEKAKQEIAKSLAENKEAGLAAANKGHFKIQTVSNKDVEGTLTRGMLLGVMEHAGVVPTGVTTEDRIAFIKDNKAIGQLSVEKEKFSRYLQEEQLQMNKMKARAALEKARADNDANTLKKKEQEYNYVNKVIDFQEKGYEASTAFINNYIKDNELEGDGANNIRTASNYLAQKITDNNVAKFEKGTTRGMYNAKTDPATYGMLVNQASKIMNRNEYVTPEMAAELAFKFAGKKQGVKAPSDINKFFPEWIIDSDLEQYTEDFMVALTRHGSFDAAYNAVAPKYRQ